MWGRFHEGTPGEFNCRAKPSAPPAGRSSGPRTGPASESWTRVRKSDAPEPQTSAFDEDVVVGHHRRIPEGEAQVHAGHALPPEEAVAAEA